MSIYDERKSNHNDCDLDFGGHTDLYKSHSLCDNRTSIDDDKNNDAQYPHGDADEEALQKQPEQGANVHLHQVGFQHGQANVVDTGVSGNDAAGIGHRLLGDVEHCHHNIEGVGDEPDGHRCFEDPAHDERRFELRHVVVLGDHLYQLVTGDEGQDDARNGQHHVPGKGFDHGEHSRLKAGGLGAHLLGNVSHLRVHIVEQTGKV